MPKTYTTRGFAVYDEIPDMYGGVVTVQESSNVEGGVWLFYKHPNNDEIDAKQPMGSKIMDPHLSDGQAERVIAALTEHLRPVGGEEDGQPRRPIWLTCEQIDELRGIVQLLVGRWDASRITHYFQPITQEYMPGTAKAELRLQRLEPILSQLRALDAEHE